MDCVYESIWQPKQIICLLKPRTHTEKKIVYCIQSVVICEPLPEYWYMWSRYKLLGISEEQISEGKIQIIITFSKI